ncbi:MAG: GyrI-like domain-containing protein [bacterium]
MAGKSKASAKLDLKKRLKHLYLPSAKEVTVIDVPEMKFIAVDGQIEPRETPSTSPGFAEAIGALYGFAFTLKFMSKQRPVDPIDYTVMALEGLWPPTTGEADDADPGEWPWTLMIMQPDHISREMFVEALAKLKGKHDKVLRREANGRGARDPDGTPVAGGAGSARTGPAIVDRVRLESFHEGLCLQILHIGPYADEPRTLEKMAALAEARGYVFRGRHHEIYLGDPRKAKPENLRTVLRRGVSRAE